MSRSGVRPPARPSVCLFHHSASGGFAAERRAGRICRSTAAGVLQQMRAVPCWQPSWRGWKRTCLYCARCTARTTAHHKTFTLLKVKGKKVTHTRLPSVGSRSWSRFLAVSLQVTWIINPPVGCHYFPPGRQLPSQPLRGLLHYQCCCLVNNGCEQFA